MAIKPEVKGHKVTKRGEPDRYYANTPRFVTIEDAQVFSDPEVRPWCYDEDPEYFEVFFATFATLDRLVEFLTQGDKE